MRNHEDFWANTIHAMRDQDWQSWCDIEPALSVEYQELWRRFPKLREDTAYIRDQLMLGKSISHKWAKGKNFTAFRTLMAIKDIINDIQGTPTVDYTNYKEPEQLTQFERLFND
jgi:hypothetical protein